MQCGCQMRGKQVEIPFTWMELISQRLWVITSSDNPNIVHINITWFCIEHHEYEWMCINTGRGRHHE